MSESLENFLEQFAQSGYGRSREKSFQKEECVKCGKSAKEFRDQISAKEYSLSGFCQKCQDDFFTND